MLLYYYCRGKCGKQKLNGKKGKGEGEENIKDNSHLDIN